MTTKEIKKELENLKKENAKLNGELKKIITESQQLFSP
tara:strand:+ start:379 stop:492 length:114 start_codon:yes stop_codon:yes gene_type:complete